jgi:hypothetical protein
VALAPRTARFTKPIPPFAQIGASASQSGGCPAMTVVPLRIPGGRISDRQVKRENRIEFTGLKGREDSPTRPRRSAFQPQRL